MERRINSIEQLSNENECDHEGTVIFRADTKPRITGYYRDRDMAVMHAYRLVNHGQKVTERQSIMDLLSPRMQVMLMEDEVCELRARIRGIDALMANGQRGSLHGERRRYDMRRRELRIRLSGMKPGSK